MINLSAVYSFSIPFLFVACIQSISARWVSYSPTMEKNYSVWKVSLFREHCRKTQQTMATEYLNCVWPNKFSICILIRDLLVSQCNPIAPVQRPNVILNRFCHGHPVVLDCQKQKRKVHLLVWVFLFPQQNFHSKTDSFHGPVILGLSYSCNFRVNLLKFKELHQHR